MSLPVSSREALFYFDHTTAEVESEKERFQLDHGKSGMMRVQFQMVPLVEIRNQYKRKHYNILKANIKLPLCIKHKLDHSPSLTAGFDFFLLLDLITSVFSRAALFPFCTADLNLLIALNLSFTN